MLWLNIPMLALAVLLLVPVAVLCAECLAALLPDRKIRPAKSPAARAARPSIAILMPAHNEQTVVAETLASIMPQVCAGDRVVVVADNCDDDTARIARGFGAIVLERRDTLHRGKGFALDHGMRFLEHDAPAAVVMLDADCTVHPGAIDALVEQTLATGRPAQACYLLERPSQSASNDLVSALAFLVKNGVRPRGLRWLGLPCLLTGTGMAFPWPVIAKAKLASGNIVEDMQLGLDLALDGHAPLFCGKAHVTGRLPQQQKIAYGQRTRWEHGHLQTVLSQVPRMFKSGLANRSVNTLALAMELSVPPLCLLMMILSGALGVAAAAGLLGASWLPACLLAGGIGLVAISLFAAWIKFGRQSLPMTALLSAPLYMAWKIPMYFAFLFKRQTEWNRTARAHAKPALGTDSGVEFEAPPVGVGIAVDTETDLNIDIPFAIPCAAAHPASAVQPLLHQASIDGGTPHAVTASECIRHIISRLDAGRGGMVVRPTLDHLRQCARDREFAELVASADLIVADSTPLSWAGRLAGAPPASRVAGSELLWKLISAATTCGRSIYLLGDDVQVTGEAAAAVQERFPSLKMAGTYNAPDGFDSAHEAFLHVAGAVSRADPDIVLVALGTPKQERLIAKLRIKLPATWWLAVGNNFQSLCDDTRKTPLAAGSSPGHGFPISSSLIGGTSVKRLARILGKSAPQEKVLRHALAEGGIDNILVAEADRDLESADAASVVAALLPSAPGQSVVYQSFIKGFVSELASHGSRPEFSINPNPRGSSHRDGPLGRLRALVLLGGSVRPTRMTTAIGRSMLDLPLEDGRSLLWHWRDHAIELRRLIGLEQLPVRVLVDQISPQPTPPARGTHVPVRVERDLSQYRGTGGVLRDLSDDYFDDDFILVANAAQCLLSPLSDLAAALAASASDLTVVSHEDGTPSGLMLIRCQALRAIATTGYVDMKEQALPQLATQFNVQHLPHAYPTGLPIRSLGEYVAAIQYSYRHQLGRPISNDPFAEDCRPSFAVIEEGAIVHPSARVHDSVVLRGARIGEHAMVVRSVICSGVVLGAGEHAVDQLVSSDFIARAQSKPAPRALAAR